MILNGTLVRQRRIELRRSLRQVAADVGVTGAVIAALEGGTNHKDLPVGLLRRLADALGLELSTLIAPDDPTAGDSGDPGDDAATVGAVLHASEILTPIDTLAEVLDWPLVRVEAALDQLDAALRPTGLRLHRLHRCAAIRRSVEAAPTRTIERAVRAHLANEGLSITEARVLAAVRDGQLTKELRNADQVALGTLHNAGLVEVGPPPARTTQGPWQLTDDVRYSLLLDA